MTDISSFRGKYRFLSNFYPAPVNYLDQVWDSVEYAYQAAKCNDPNDRFLFLQAKTSGLAKKIGKVIDIRPDWEVIKIEVMDSLVRQKFTVHDDLGRMLLDTGDAKLIEGNNWGDTFWGQCPVGVGENHLGIVLMKVREELRHGS